MAEQNVTDLSYLYSISMGDDTLVEEMIVLFLEGAPPIIETLKELVHKEDWSGVAVTAHKLKPNLAYMGLNSAQKVLEKLEKNARNGKDLGDIKKQITRIEQICNQSYPELNEILAELRS